VIEVINLGLNNLSSVLSAIESRTAQEVRAISSAKESQNPQLMVLPGTGSFGSAAGRLRQEGFFELISESLKSSEFFFAGICLGMQLLALKSEESPSALGLGILPGEVLRLDEFAGPDGRVPHVGWASLVRENPLDFGEMQRVGDVYFSHSYHLVAHETSLETIHVDYGSRRFLAAIRFGNISGYQFHPEKSSATGLAFIDDLLKWSHIEN
jgi:glutamine amidotransferase